MIYKIRLATGIIFIFALVSALVFFLFEDTGSKVYLVADFENENFKFR